MILKKTLRIFNYKPYSMKIKPFHNFIKGMFDAYNKNNSKRKEESKKILLKAIDELNHNFTCSRDEILALSKISIEKLKINQIEVIYKIA